MVGLLESCSQASTQFFVLCWPLPSCLGGETEGVCVAVAVGLTQTLGASAKCLLCFCLGYSLSAQPIVHFISRE